MLIELSTPAPILNTPDFAFAFGGRDGKEIPLNERCHPYCFEFVGLKGMVFQVEEAMAQGNAWIYRVACPFYSEPKLYLDSRFAKAAEPPVLRGLPAAETILQRMKEKIGTPYVWGGNWSAGIPKLLEYYPPKGFVDDRTLILWTLKGIDCSGLLYEATEGATPRNTAQLLRFGKAVPIGAELKPLDMILYPGHILFILNDTTTIESKFPLGVICRNLSERLWELERERKRVNEWTSELDLRTSYVIRRLT
jgi:hypothetical protein